MFNKAYNKLKQLEGGYVNDPIDKGGETYKGISRNNFPKWDGWKTIDALKETNHFEELLKANFELKHKVENFYKTEFWNYFNCDVIEENIANELFEASVNVGKPRATIFLQTALNLLNNNQKIYSNIRVDGKLGAVTQSTLKVCLHKVESSLLFNILNILQGAYYIELMLNNEVKEKYIGWFSRVEILKLG